MLSEHAEHIRHAVHLSKMFTKVLNEPVFDAVDEVFGTGSAMASGDVGTHDTHRDAEETFADLARCDVRHADLMEGLHDGVDTKRLAVDETAIHVEDHGRRTR